MDLPCLTASACLSACSVFFCNDSCTSGEHAGAARRQFALMRGVRHLCPASGFLFTMPFDPVYRWLMSAVLPHEPHQQGFLERDVLVHTPTILPSQLLPCELALSLNHKKYCWIQFGDNAFGMGRHPCPSLSANAGQGPCQIFGR